MTHAALRLPHSLLLNPQPPLSHQPPVSRHLDSPLCPSLSFAPLPVAPCRATAALFSLPSCTPMHACVHCRMACMRTAHLSLDADPPHSFSPSIRPPPLFSHSSSPPSPSPLPTPGSRRIRLSPPPPLVSFFSRAQKPRPPASPRPTAPLSPPPLIYLLSHPTPIPFP